MSVSLPIGLNGAPATLQPVAQAAPNDGPTTSSGTPSGIYQISPAMNGQLESAINNAFAGIRGGVSNAHIQTSVVNQLRATGQWSEGMLAIVTNALQSAGAGAKGGIQQSNQGPGLFDTQWYSDVVQAITGAVTQQSAPPSSNTTTPVTNDDSDSLIEELLPYLSGAQNAGTATSAGSDGTQDSVPYYAAATGGSSGGGSPILGILLLLAAAIAGIWWYVKHKKDLHELTHPT